MTACLTNGNRQRLNPNKYDANGRNLSTAYDNIEVYINKYLVETITNTQKEMNDVREKQLLLTQKTGQLIQILIQ